MYCTECGKECRVVTRNFGPCASQCGTHLDDDWAEVSDCCEAAPALLPKGVRIVDSLPEVMSPDEYDPEQPLFGERP